MENRSKYLYENIEYYDNFPQGYDMDVDYSHLPPLLNFDFHKLNGILPLTQSRYNSIGLNAEMNGKKVSALFVNPLPEEYEYYEKLGVTEFQAISIVINFYAFEKTASKVLKGLPYCVTLLPGTERDKIDTWNIELLKQFDLEELCQRGGTVFTDYAPFKKWNQGIGADYSLFSKITRNEFSDSIGFEWGMYFLAPVFDKSELIFEDNKAYSKAINAKYKKYKGNRYFKAFTDTNPRQIWGCDSPIELFLLQGLYIRKIVPEIQMGFYRSGEIFPNYYKMAENGIYLPEDRLLTTSDFYYPEHKLALFCDGQAFHDIEKDEKIDADLNAIGIQSIRFTGKRITEDLEAVLDEIEECLKNTII